MKQTARASGAKILVVDDDFDLRSTIVAALKKNQFKVFEAGDAEAAVDLARKHHPDLILCDWGISARDGTRCVKMLQSSGPVAGIPFILMTGQPSAATVGNLTLVKPFTIKLLLTAIHQKLEEQRPGAAPAAADNSSSAPALRTGAVQPFSREELEALLHREQHLREVDRTHTARAIHDHFSQRLTVLAIELSLLEEDLRGSKSGRGVAAVRKLNTVVSELIAAAQELTAQLRPKILDEFGFVAALEWLLRDLEKTAGLRSEFHLAIEEPALPPEMATEIFRLSQEILTTMAGHVSHINVDVSENRDFLSIRFGWDTNGSMGESSLREEMLGIRYRVERLGGSCTRDYSICGRVELTLRIPLL